MLERASGSLPNYPGHPPAAAGGLVSAAADNWGDPRLKSSALQAQMLKSLKSMPGHTFKAPETNRVKSVKSGRFS